MWRRVRLTPRLSTEPLRVLLRHGGIIAYTNKVYTWPEWSEVKQSFPFARLPVLEVDGRFIAESGALARLIACWAGALQERQPKHGPV